MVVYHRNTAYNLQMIPQLSQPSNVTSNISSTYSQNGSWIGLIIRENKCSIFGIKNVRTDSKEYKP